MAGRWPGLWLVCVAALACTPGTLTAGQADDLPQPVDAGPPDGAPADDGGPPDDGPPDPRPTDPQDLGRTDQSPTDQALADQGSPDAGADQGPSDASIDRGQPDQGPPPDVGPPIAPPAWLGVTHATVKLRPHAQVPAAKAVALDAARNEFEIAQIAVSGGDAGRRVTAVRPSALTGPGGVVIPADAWVVYQAALFNVPSASNLEGAPGLWPDPLIPDVDPYAHERRRAFPLAVPAGQVRALWAELLVPQDAAPGEYRGDVEVDVDDATVAVPVRLRVRAFALPSTASLPTAFGMGWNDACLAHHGSYEACGADAGVEAFHVRYAELALDHRISIEQVVYAGPAGDDWGHFDGVYGPLLDGTAHTRLPGARLTTIRSTATTAEQFARWGAHFAERGWLDRLFQYTCDEPPHGCPFEQIAPRAANAQPARVRTLVTTDLETATRQGVIAAIDVLVPILQSVHREGGIRPSLQPWLDAEPARRRLWWYQSCISHGCGQGCATTPTAEHTGWPSYVIDAAAVQARAMEWLSFRYGMGGELYFQTTHTLPSAWSDQCAFSGAGDGNLLYPGTPERIGGRTHIPVASVRLKLIREGLEDYEYLHLLESLGEGDFARAQVDALFPVGQAVTDVDGDRVMAVRRALADRIEARLQAQ